MQTGNKARYIIAADSNKVSYLSAAKDSRTGKDVFLCHVWAAELFETYSDAELRLASIDAVNSYVGERLLIMPVNSTLEGEIIMPNALTWADVDAARWSWPRPKIREAFAYFKRTGEMPYSENFNI